ncbi:MAG: hypothetical protein ABI823_12460, partial [Bryobacteraceae bacterium]
DKRYIEYRAGQSKGLPADSVKTILLAQWEWMTGRPDAAKLRLANRPEFAAQLILWNGEAAKLPPPYAFLALRRFEDALPLWRKAYELSDPSQDGLARTLYAWCLAETGHSAEAKDLMKYYPIPPQADGIFATLIYPRALGLRK